MFISAWTEDVNSLEEKASLRGGGFGSQGGTLVFFCFHEVTLLRWCVKQ
jgi:hypothetical protein